MIIRIILLFKNNILDKFNLIIGGKTTENGIKLKGMNEIINLYSQKKDDKKIRKKRLKQLYKQKTV